VKRRAGHPRAGFTLIELILVLVLIAVLTALATPALRGFTRRAALDDTAAAMLTLTQQAQSRAAHEAVPYRVVFDLDERRSWLERIGDEGYEEVVANDVEPITWGQSVTLVSDIDRDDDGQLAIGFQPTGLVTPGSVVIEQDGHFVALTCLAATQRYRLTTPADMAGRNAEGVLDAMRL
jgi:type II secretion system protein H